MSKDKVSRYAESGVDIDKGNEFIDRIKPIVAKTFQRGVLTDIGGFGGLFALGGDRYKDPVLVSSTDGVGTKLKIATMCNKHDTIGIDLVAMCVNDVVVSGARPLFFLDYFSMAKLDVDMAADVVKGIADGCEISKCSLIGGETAEMPGHYAPDDYDIAGFVVGIAERDDIIDGSDIRVGNKIIGLASSGIHSNGYSLVRKICFEELGLTVNDHIDELGCTLGEELLRPTRIYTEALLNLIRNFKVNGMVHITGGGFFDNIPRILPQGCKAIIEDRSWEVLPIFDFLREKGNVTPEEMCRTFNCGIGMVVVVDAKDEEDVVQQLTALGEKPFVIGEVVQKKNKKDSSVEINCCATLNE
ncbi:MAG: phosphoribosylformylglycinamidine cyclo-ligase [Desulfobulbaceae bacterium]|nr:phosphoribosylformylglycinamidine cyclo-ligase [Desulfobulbaceae bacterium]